MQKQENAMGTRPIFGLLMKMSIPPMISMLIQSMYNIVDSIFVAQIGEDALTAVSLAFPLQNLALAFAVGLGVAVNALIAKALGAKDKEGVQIAATHGLLLTGIHSLFFVGLGLFFTRPFLSMFSPSFQVLNMSCQYTYIVITLAFGSLFHITIEKMFQAQGVMKLPMIMQGVGAIINIILDPIMIFGWFGFPRLEVIGAAIATVIGQMCACLLSVAFFLKSNQEVQVSFKGFRLHWRTIGKLYSIAVPSALMTSMPSILVSILNGILAPIHESAVAVYGLYNKMQTFVYNPTSGLVQGMRPIVSYNLGAGYHNRMKKAIKMSILVSCVIMAFGTLVFMAIPEQIMLLFNATEETMQMGVTALRIISCGFLVSSVGVVLSGVFEAVGQGIQSLIITLLRQLVIIVPLSLVLSKPLGLIGVWITFPISELAGALVGVIMTVFLFQKLKKELLY
jgi:putative MATE family efflux protein